MIVGPVSNARSRDLSFHLCLYFLCFHCDYEIQSYWDESTHEKFLSFAPRKSVCSEALPSFSVHEYLSLSCSCIPQHTENGSPTALEATLANPHTHTIVETFGKSYVYGVLRFRTSTHYVTTNDSR